MWARADAGSRQVFRNQAKAGTDWLEAKQVEHLARRHAPAQRRQQPEEGIDDIVGSPRGAIGDAIRNTGLMVCCPAEDGVNEWCVRIDGR